jgi:glycosyltransferase involved in cell wall biosynthesis
MRIGIMLRSYDEKGGIGVYTRNMVQELLRLESAHQFTLYFRNPTHLGRFSDRKNVTERVVTAPNKAMWDQLAIPIACLTDKIDVLFHPKFTIPLAAPCKTVMAVHGADFFIPEQAQFYSRSNVIYNRLMLPRYFAKCAKVISVSQLCTDDFNRVLKLPLGKIQTVYFGPARHFRRVTDEATLTEVKARYSLPECYIFTVARRSSGSRKNFGGLLEAYKLYHQNTPTPYKLVIGGKDCAEFKAIYAIPDHGYGKDIIFTDWIDQEAMPAVYSMAALYLYPSNLEAFPIPVTEAMTCGTPLITSNVNGLREIAGDAAFFVNPDDSCEIATAIERVLAHPDMQEELSQKGLARAAMFSWEKCARETLAIFEQVHITND